MCRSRNNKYLNLWLRIIYSKHHALFIYLFIYLFIFSSKMTVVLTVQQYIVGYHNIQKVEKWCNYYLGKGIMYYILFNCLLLPQTGKNQHSPWNFFLIFGNKKNLFPNKKPPLISSHPASRQIFTFFEF